MAQLGIYKAISGVIADIGAVGKDGVNVQQKYKFRSIDDVYNVLNPALAKNKVFIVPEILEERREVKHMKSGAEPVFVICRIKYTFYAEDGSFIEAVVIGEGMDYGDKATNKAMAIGYKYVCFQVFCIPTEDLMDDPDKESPEVVGNKNQGDAKQKVSSTKASTQKKQEYKSSEKPTEGEQVADQEPRASTKITADMIKTIRAEQERTGVTDKQILAKVKAKNLEDMTIAEFRKIMGMFEVTKSKE